MSQRNSQQYYDEEAAFAGEQEEFIPRNSRGSKAAKNAGGMSTGLIIGCAVGGLALVAIIIIIIVVVMSSGGDDEKFDCKCTDGKAKEGKQCSKRDEQWCVSCKDDTFELKNKQCKAKVTPAQKFACECPNGTKAEGKVCNSQGEERCTACNNPFTLVDGKCKDPNAPPVAQVACECTGGSPVMKADNSGPEMCPENDKENCASCTEANFHVVDKKCVERPQPPAPTQQQIMGSLLHKYMSFKTQVPRDVARNIIGVEGNASQFDLEKLDNFKTSLTQRVSNVVKGSWSTLDWVLNHDVMMGRVKDFFQPSYADFTNLAGLGAETQQQIANRYEFSVPPATAARWPNARRVAGVYISDGRDAPEQLQGNYQARDEFMGLKMENGFTFRVKDEGDIDVQYQLGFPWLVGGVIARQQNVDTLPARAFAALPAAGHRHHHGLNNAAHDWIAWDATAGAYKNMKCFSDERSTTNRLGAAEYMTNFIGDRSKIQRHACFEDNSAPRVGINMKLYSDDQANLHRFGQAPIRLMTARAPGYLGRPAASYDSDFSVATMLGTDEGTVRENSFEKFNRWVQRFTRAGDNMPLFERDNEDDIDQVKKVGTSIAIRGIAPVFGKLKGRAVAADARGGIEEYGQGDVKNHHFIWAAWVNHKDTTLESNGSVKKVFMEDTARTLKMMKKLLPNQNDVLSLQVPAEYLPATGLAKVAYRQAFLNVVSKWAHDQKVRVILHGLTKNSASDFEEENIENLNVAELEARITLDEFKYIEEGHNPYLFPMPYDADATDLVVTAETFILASKESHAFTPNPNPTAIPDPEIVTLIPGDSWEHIGGQAHNESKTAAQRMTMVAPLITYLFNFATNPVLRYMMMRQLKMNP